MKHGEWRLLTPPTGGRFGACGAIAAIELTGDVEESARSLGFEAPPVGRTALRTIAGVDRGLVARPSAGSLLLFPHAGPAILEKLVEALDRAGIQRKEAAHDAARAALSTVNSQLSTLESRMLAALARTSSPLAVDLLLDQPRRWRETPNPDPVTLAHRSAILNRLLDPPTIVALGAPNIGKSTLLNALAGRSVSIVADLPGTTRDHVGVGLELAGLAVRWIDTPGLRGLTTPSEARAQALDERDAEQLALEAARSADLVVLCEDGASSGQLTVDSGQRPEAERTWAAIIAALSPPAGFIRARLRADLAPDPPAVHRQLSTVNYQLSTINYQLSIPPASPPRNLEHFVRALREALVPPDVLADPGPWDLPRDGWVACSSGTPLEHASPRPRL